LGGIHWVAELASKVMRQTPSVDNSFDRLPGLGDRASERVAEHNQTGDR